MSNAGAGADPLAKGDLCERLLRFLDREEAGERRNQRDLRALSIRERVLEGECIQRARLQRRGDAWLEFWVRENHSKFRRGDALTVGDGRDFDAVGHVTYESYDPVSGTLRVALDRWQRRMDVELRDGLEYCLDRRALDLRGQLQDVVSAAFADERVCETLRGDWVPEFDDGRAERARALLEERGLNAAQVEAGAAAIATERIALVQGPPGTGKTRLLAEILRALSAKGCRIALSAFTHRAIDNVLLALRALDPDMPLVKLGDARSSRPEVKAKGVRFVPPRRAEQLPTGGLVVGGTCFALAKLLGATGFHFTVFDEAGQLPVSHALPGMLLAPRQVFVGDHRQLPPVTTTEHADALAHTSVFELLHSHYGSRLLDTTYRMNGGLCRVISDLFYDGALHTAAESEPRRLPQPAGSSVAQITSPLLSPSQRDALLDPGAPVTIARVDHFHPGMRSQLEARCVVELVGALIERHGVPAAEIAVVAPFRAQIRQIRSALAETEPAWLEGLTIDTIERIQGQEREVVVLSMAVGDPDTLSRRSTFFFSTNRLNVACSRARTKAVLVASRGAFEALPSDPESLRAAAVFRKLWRTVPVVAVRAVEDRAASGHDGRSGVAVTEE